MNHTEIEDLTALAELHTNYNKLAAHAQRLAKALELALVQWPAAHRDQPRIIGQIKSALAAWEDAQ